METMDKPVLIPRLNIVLMAVDNHHYTAYTGCPGTKTWDTSTYLSSLRNNTESEEEEKKKRTQGDEAGRPN